MAECRIRTIEGLHLATVSARRGRAEEASTAALRAFGIELPLAPRIVAGEGIAFAWSGPAQWLCLWERAGARQSRASSLPQEQASLLPQLQADDIESLLAPVFDGTATVCEQSDARVVIEIAGNAARAVLAKGLPLDLHARAFGPGAVALSVVSHIAVMIWQVDAEPTFRIAVPRGYAGSFRRWLEESAAEFEPVYG